MNTIKGKPYPNLMQDGFDSDKMHLDKILKGELGHHLLMDPMHKVIFRMYLNKIRTRP